MTERSVGPKPFEDSSEPALVVPAQVPSAVAVPVAEQRAERPQRPLLDEVPSSLRLLDGAVGTVVVLLAAAVVVSLSPSRLPWLLLAPSVGVAWVLCLSVARAYEPRYLWSGSAEGHRVVAAGGVLTVCVLLLGWLSVPSAFALPALATTAAVVVSTLAARWLVRLAAQRRHRAGKVRLRVLLVGPAADVRFVRDRIERNRYHGWKVVAACTPDADVDGTGPVRLGSPADVVTAAGKVHADLVVLCPGVSVADIDDLRQVQQELEADGRELAISPPLVEAIGPRVSLSSVCGLPVVRLGLPELTGPRRLVKSVGDRFVAGAATLVLLPLLAVVALAVRLDSPGPALFRQVRIGRDGRPFTMVKFRTMYTDAEERKAALLAANEGAGLLFKIREDPRVTRVGRLLRRTSLDELPQLLNILTGDMSFVGPRPGLPDEAMGYDGFIRRRLLVRPGLTGLWQVHGRSDLSWRESRRLDVRYVENWSLGFDFSIMLRTVEAVLRGRGAY